MADVRVGTQVRFYHAEDPTIVEDSGIVTDFTFLTGQYKWAIIIASEKWDGKPRSFFVFDENRYWHAQKIDPLFPEQLAYDPDGPRLGIKAVTRQHAEPRPV
jgi:hypothetical protein